MAEYNENRIFKKLAARYVEHYGEMLKDEAERLNQQPGVTPRMDKKIRRHIKSGNKLRYVTGLAAFAAAIALAIMLPALTNLYNSGVVSDGQSAAASQEPAPSSASSAAAPPAQEAEAPPAPEIIPISFTLPGHLTVTDSKLDNGKSVYYLSNSELDDIVMTMELDPKEDVFAGLRETSINGSAVYYKYTADYSVMAFQKRDVTYVLTCKYDVNTLVPLAEAII